MADPSPDPGSARLDRLVALAVAALALGAVLIGTFATGSGHPSGPTVTVAPADDPSCAEWSDGCRVCQRLADGPACSLPGIACTLGPQECLRKSAP